MTRYDILPPAQKVLIPELAAARELGFVLYGGTAIALQLGHRESIDFDFFSDRPLSESALIAAMPRLGDGETLERAPNSWTLQLFPLAQERPVKLSFFGGLGFGRVGAPLKADGHELLMASLDDLFGHKLKVLLQRVEAKDYRDLAALLRAGETIEQGLGAASALFATFPPAEALRAMSYFEGGDLGSLALPDRELLSVTAAQAGEPVSIGVVSQRLTPD